MKMYGNVCLQFRWDKYVHNTMFGTYVCHHHPVNCDDKTSLKRIINKIHFAADEATGEVDDLGPGSDHW